MVIWDTPPCACSGPGPVWGNDHLLLEESEVPRRTGRRQTWREAMIRSCPACQDLERLQIEKRATFVRNTPRRSWFCVFICSISCCGSSGASIRLRCLCT